MPDLNEPKQPRPRTPRYGEGKPARRAGGRRQVDDAFEDLLDRFTNHLENVKYRPFRTRNTYANWTRVYYRWLVATKPDLALEGASPETIRAFIAFKLQTLKPCTLGTILQSLRSFYDFLLLGDPIRPNPTTGVKGPRVIPSPVDAFTEEEVRHTLMIAQRYEHSDDIRRWVGYVALTILAGAGIRNGELRHLRTENVDLARRELRVLGKGSKERIIPFGPATAAVLTTYAEELRPQLPDSPYFVVNPTSLRKGPYVGRMAEKAFVALVEDLLTEAGISGRTNPHRFRHSYATLTMSKTGNMALTKEQLGHASITTTSRYVHTTMKDRHDAADVVDLVPRSKVTEPTVSEMPSPTEPVDLPVAPATVVVEHLPVEEPPVGLVPFEHPTPPQPLLAMDLSQPASVGRREGGPHREDLRGGAEAILGDAVEIARHLPPQLLVHLNSERLVEVALGSLITTGLNSEVFLAAAGAVLSWAHDLPLSLDPLLATYGTDVLDALLQVRSTLELLSRLDPPGR